VEDKKAETKAPATHRRKPGSEIRLRVSSVLNTADLHLQE